MINGIKFDKNVKFLVTGGAGFIGSNIVEKLLNLGYFVRILDNFSTGKRKNIEPFLNNPNFELIQGDIRITFDCYKACKGINYVLHQAALGSVPRSIEDPKTTNDVNITGTLNMLIASRDNKVKRFVYASSSSVYGDNNNLPKVENVIGKPLSPYAITKVNNELYSKNFHELYNLPTIGLRYFNVYGKNQDPNSVYAAVIPIFISKLLNNETLVIYGDGEQSRDFTFIENIVNANLKACLANEKALGEVFNIAYGGQITINELYNKISNLLNKNIKPKYECSRKGDVRHSFANIEKAKNLLNYNPQYTIDEGLKKTINWYINTLT